MEPSLLLAVRKSNRKALVRSTVVLVLVGLFLLANESYYYNALYGPFPKSNRQLCSIADIAKEKQLYVTVEGDTVFESNFTQVEKQTDQYSKRVVSQSTVGYYQLLLVDHKILVVLSAKQDTTLRRVGALCALPIDLRKMIVESAETQNSDWLLPIMLDARLYSTNAYIGLAVMIPVSCMSLVFLVLGVWWSLDPTKHPIYRAAVAESGWLREHQGTEYQSFVPTCGHCGYHKRLIHSTYSSNVSHFFRRTVSEVEGNYCLYCNSQLFVHHTSITLLGTWWGFIGFFVGPFYILQNLYNYARAILGFLFRR